VLVEDSRRLMEAQLVVDALNAARSRELAVIIQYMEHHYVAASLQGLPGFVRQTRSDMWVSSRGSGLGARVAGAPGAVDLLKSIAKVEMMHAQSFGNRITALGGSPTVTPSERFTAVTVLEMIKLDVAAEGEAVAMYEASIELCRNEQDDQSEALFERVLRDERAHLAAFRDLLVAASR
jgi:bacterioferritin (cytochrome b1)